MSISVFGFERSIANTVVGSSATRNRPIWPPVHSALHQPSLSRSFSSFRKNTGIPVVFSSSRTVLPVAAIYFYRFESIPVVIISVIDSDKIPVELVSFHHLSTVTGSKVMVEAVDMPQR